MPLIILGVLLLISLLTYAIIKYKRDYQPSMKKVKSKLDEAFEKARSQFNRDAANFSAEEFDLDEKSKSGDDNTIHFPTENLETEKHKRNIH